MRVAFFGGSFDPPHLGHLQIALTAQARLRLDRVLLAPAGRQPLKRQEAAGFADRMAMLRLLIEGHAGLEVSTCDAPLGVAEGVAGGGAGGDAAAAARPNYTVDTLARLRPALLSGMARGGAERSGARRGGAGAYGAQEKHGAGTFGAGKLGAAGEQGRLGKPEELGERSTTRVARKPGEFAETGKPGPLGELDQLGAWLGARLVQRGASRESSQSDRVGELGCDGKLELYFLAGADSFLTLPQWHRPEELLRSPDAGGSLDGWILAARPGFSLEALGGALPAGYRVGPVREQVKADSNDGGDGFGRVHQFHEFKGFDEFQRLDGSQGSRRLEGLERSRLKESRLEGFAGLGGIQGVHGLSGLDGPAGFDEWHASGGRAGLDRRDDRDGLAGPVVTRQVWLPGGTDWTDETGLPDGTHGAQGRNGTKGVAGTRLYLLPDLEDSSTATSIREALQQGRAVPHLLPEISRYIRDHGLYRMLG